LICAITFGWLRWQIDSYRKDWEVEQRALGEMRKTGTTFTASTRPIGPVWLRSLAGMGYAKYFDRVDTLFFTASSLDEKYGKSFKHMKAFMVD
jgi:hypothetical protein